MSSDSTYILVEQSDLTWAVQQGLLSKGEVAALWPALVKRTAGRSGGVSLAQVAFYFGTLVIIGALTWFLTEAWDSPPALFGLSLAYSIVFGAAGVRLWFDQGKTYGIPPVVGGLFVTVSVALLPLSTGSAEAYFHYAQYHDGRLPVELTAIVAGSVALYYVRFPFLMAPIALALGVFAVADAPQLFFGQEPTDMEAAVVTFTLGLAMNVLAVFVDKVVKPAEDFGFWLYLFGSFASFGGLGYLEGLIHSLDPYNVAFAVFSVLNLIEGGLVNRKSLVVFGSIGSVMYLSWITWAIFRDSWAFPFILTALGIFVIYLGVQLQKWISGGNNNDHAEVQEVPAVQAEYQMLPTSVDAEAPAMHFMPMSMPMSMPMTSPYFIVPAPVTQEPKTVEV